MLRAEVRTDDRGGEFTDVVQAGEEGDEIGSIGADGCAGESAGISQLIEKIHEYGLNIGG